MTRTFLSLVGVATTGLLLAGASTSWCDDRDWLITTLDADGNVGQYADLQIDDAGDLHVVYWRSDDGTLKMVSPDGGAWGTPSVVDDCGAVAGHCDVAPTAAGELPVSYRRDDTNALWYAGPEVPAAWTTEPLTTEVDDVGRHLKTTWGSGDELALAFYNQTQENLQHMRRVDGLWEPPVTVDPGPARGTYCDLTHRPGVGYAFSYYTADAGLLTFADPEIVAQAWAVRSVDHHVDLGRQLSMIKGPEGHLDYVYFAFDQWDLGQVRAGEMIPDSVRILCTVEDSVATSTSAHIYPDVYVMPGEDWYISFRDDTDGHLYMATAEYWQVEPQDIVEDPVDDTTGREARKPHLLGASPNPSAGLLHIAFYAPGEAPVHLRAVDASGRIVREIDAESHRGVNVIDLRCDGGLYGRLPAGVYFVKLQVGDTVLGPQKVMLLR